MKGKPTTIIVYDYETSGLDAGDMRDLSKPRNEILQIGAVAYDFASLEPIPGAEFITLLRPTFWDKLDPGAMKVNGIKVEDLKDPAKTPGQKEGWLRFVSWVNQFNPGSGARTAPYAAGKNQRNFDSRFTAVMNELYCKGPKTVLFNDRKDFDLEDEVLRWFSWNGELTDEKMDTLREYFGIPVHPWHDALVDAKEEGMILVKFLNLYRTLFNWKDAQGNRRIKMRGCFRKAS